MYTMAENQFAPIQEELLKCIEEKGRIFTLTLEDTKQCNKEYLQEMMHAVFDFVLDDLCDCINKVETDEYSRIIIESLKYDMIRSVKAIKQTFRPQNIKEDAVKEIMLEAGETLKADIIRHIEVKKELILYIMKEDTRNWEVINLIFECQMKRPIYADSSFSFHRSKRTYSEGFDESTKRPNIKRTCDDF